MDRSYLLKASSEVSAVVVFRPLEVGELGAELPLGEKKIACPDSGVNMAGVHTVVEKATGTTAIHLVTRNKHGQLTAPYVLDWQQFGEIGLAFADAVYRQNLSPISIESKLRCLGHFLKWHQLQSSTGSKTALESLTTDDFRSYISYLNRATRSSGQSDSYNTKRARLSAVRSTVAFLQRFPGNWKTSIQDRVRVPPNRSINAGAHSKPTSVLSSDQFRVIILAAAADVERQIANYDQTETLIAIGRDTINAGSGEARDFTDFNVVLATVADQFGGCLGSIRKIRQINPGLANEIQYRHGLTKLIGHFSPRPLDLVPFIVLLTIHTVGHLEN